MRCRRHGHFPVKCPGICYPDLGDLIWNTHVLASPSNPPRSLNLQERPGAVFVRDLRVDLR